MLPGEVLKLKIVNSTLNGLQLQSSTIYACTTSHLPAFGFFLYCMTDRVCLSTVHFNQTILYFIMSYSFLCFILDIPSYVLYLANSDPSLTSASIKPNNSFTQQIRSSDLYPVRWYNINNQRLSWSLCYGATIYNSFSGKPLS